jgi:hypothetical protein
LEFEEGGEKGHGVSFENGTLKIENGTAVAPFVFGVLRG